MTNKNIKFFILLISVFFVFFELCSSNAFKDLGLQRSNAINCDPGLIITPTAPQFEGDNFCNDNATSELDVKTNNSVTQEVNNNEIYLGPKELYDQTMSFKIEGNGNINLQKILCNYLIVNLAKIEGNGSIKINNNQIMNKIESNNIKRLKKTIQKKEGNGGIFKNFSEKIYNKLILELKIEGDGQINIESQSHNCKIVESKIEGNGTITIDGCQDTGGQKITGDGLVTINGQQISGKKIPKKITNHKGPLFVNYGSGSIYNFSGKSNIKITQSNGVNNVEITNSGNGTVVDFSSVEKVFKKIGKFYKNHEPFIVCGGIITLFCLCSFILWKKYVRTLSLSYKSSGNQNQISINSSGHSYININNEIIIGTPPKDGQYSVKIGNSIMIG